ncbi:MAG: hypothetical protein AAF327_05320 [Cyanobacteria bacterium P01_A01_bin.37]
MKTTTSLAHWMQSQAQHSHQKHAPPQRQCAVEEAFVLLTHHEVRYD